MSRHTPAFGTMTGCPPPRPLSTPREAGPGGPAQTRASAPQRHSLLNADRLNSGGFGPGRLNQKPAASPLLPCGFDRICALAATLERCMREGWLDYVFPGKSELLRADLDRLKEAFRLR